MIKIEIRKSLFERAVLLSIGFESFDDQIQRMLKEIAYSDTPLSNVSVKQPEKIHEEEIIHLELSNDSFSDLSKIRVGYEDLEGILNRVLTFFELNKDSVLPKQVVEEKTDSKEGMSMPDTLTESVVDLVPVVKNESVKYSSEDLSEDIFLKYELRQHEVDPKQIDKLILGINITEKDNPALNNKEPGSLPEINTGSFAPHSLESIEVTEETVNKLKFSRPGKLTIDGLERKFKFTPNWTDALTFFYQLALLSYSYEDVSEFTGSLLTKDLNKIPRSATLINERSKIYAGPSDVSKSVKIMYAIAERLDIDFYLSFSWKAGINKGKNGFVSYTREVNGEIIEISTDETPVLSFSSPKNVFLNDKEIKSLRPSWWDALEWMLDIAILSNSSSDVLAVTNLNRSTENNLPGAHYLDSLGLYIQRVDAPRTARNIIAISQAFNINVDISVIWGTKSEMSGKKGRIKLTYEKPVGITNGILVSNKSEALKEDAVEVKLENLNTESNITPISLKIDSSSVPDTLEKEIVEINDIVLIEWGDESRNKIKVDESISSTQPIVKIHGINIVGAHTPIAQKLLGMEIGYTNSIGERKNSKQFTVIKIMDE